jgi:hypothetical protein
MRREWIDGIEIIAVDQCNGGLENLSSQSSALLDGSICRSDREGQRVHVASRQHPQDAVSHVCRVGAGTLSLRWRLHGGSR